MRCSPTRSPSAAPRPANTTSRATAPSTSACCARAAVGGTVLAATTHVKFLVVSLGLAAFWAGFAAGVNYALSFVVVQLLHGTVATKQPAMTAPAMARKLTDEVGADASAETLEGFVDEVAHLIRSQAAGIFGNLAARRADRAAGAARLGRRVRRRRSCRATEAEHVLESITLLGPTAFYRGVHRRAAVREQPDRRLGRELVRLAPARQRNGVEPAPARPPGPGARAAPERLVARQHLGPGGQHLARA